MNALRLIKGLLYINLCLDCFDLVQEFRLISLVDVDDFLCVRVLDGVADGGRVIIRCEFLLGEFDGFRVGGVADGIGTLVDFELDVTEGHLDTLDEKFFFNLDSAR